VNPNLFRSSIKSAAPVTSKAAEAGSGETMSVGKRVPSAEVAVMPETKKTVVG
jgi:hypothetical protein